jgi:hypothetical protein
MEQEPKDEAHEQLKELCEMIVAEAVRQDDLLSCPHTWLYDEERDDRVCDQD